MSVVNISFTKGKSTQFLLLKVLLYLCLSRNYYIQRGGVEAKLIKKLKTQKGAVVNYEKTNCDTIIFALGKTKEFWEVLDNSALIMYNIMHEPLRLKTRMKVGEDYATKRMITRLPYHSTQIGKIEKGLIASGVVLDYSDSELKVFRIAKALARKQFDKWRKEEAVKLATRDAMLMPIILNTEMSYLVRELGNEIALAVEHMRGSVREVYGNRLAEMNEEIYKILRQKEIDRERFEETLGYFGFLVSILTDREAIDDKLAGRIGKIIKAIREEINTEDGDRKGLQIKANKSANKKSKTSKSQKSADSKR